MYKEQFIRSLAKKYRRPQRHYQEALTEILQGIQEHLAEGKPVSFIGFGTFYTRMKKGGHALNFKTKQKMEYKAVRQVGFHVGDVLKHAVRRRKAAK